MSAFEGRPHFADLGKWLEQVMEGVADREDTGPWTLRVGYSLAREITAKAGKGVLPSELTVGRAEVSLQHRDSLLDGQWELLGNEGVVLYGAIQGYVWDED